MAFERQQEIQFLGIQQRSAGRSAGVVDQDLDRVGLQERGQGFRGMVRQVEIAHQALMLALGRRCLEFGQGSRQGVFVARHQGHRGAQATQFQRRCPADAPAGAADQCRLAL